MMIARLLRQAAIAVGTVVAVAGLQAGPASAQLFWDWGGGNMVGGSGREVVRFSPKFGKGEVIVSFGDRRLYYVTKPGEAISYPIAISARAKPLAGRHHGVAKARQSVLDADPEMMRENPRLPRWVPGGHPMNPLGVRALYLGSSTYRIHGTDAPWTIGTNVSKGCIRMYNQDVLDLYPRVNVGTKVTVTYQNFAGVASSGPSSSPSSSSNSGGGSSFFNLFGDDPPPERPRRKVTRAKSASAKGEPTKSASSQ